MLKVSNSELQTFRDCRRKWWLSYYRGLQAPEKRTGALALGTNVHASLASYYSPNGSKGLALGVLSSIYEEARQSCSQLEIADVEKDAKLARIMVEGYFDWLEESGIDANLRIIEPEAEIEHTLTINGTPVRIVGKRDVIGVNTDTGINTLIDHKTCASFNDPVLRSEEHTSELQSQSNLVCRLLLEKKKNIKI